MVSTLLSCSEIPCSIAPRQQAVKHWPLFPEEPLAILLIKGIRCPFAGMSLQWGRDRMTQHSFSFDLLYGVPIQFPGKLSQACLLMCSRHLAGKREQMSLINVWQIHMEENTISSFPYGTAEEDWLFWPWIGSMNQVGGLFHRLLTTPHVSPTEMGRGKNSSITTQGYQQSLWHGPLALLSGWRVGELLWGRRKEKPQTNWSPEHELSFNIKIFEV